MFQLAAAVDTPQRAVSQAWRTFVTCFEAQVAVALSMDDDEAAKHAGRAQGPRLRAKPAIAKAQPSLYAMPAQQRALLNWPSTLGEVIGAIDHGSPQEEAKARRPFACARARLAKAGLPPAMCAWARRRASKATQDEVRAYYVVASLAAKAAEDAARAEGCERWSSWARKAVEGGAGVAHRFTKIPLKPERSPLDQEGSPLGEVRTFDKEAGEWRKVWTHAMDCAPPPVDVPQGEPLERPLPAAVRAAAKRFRRTTGLGVDDAHPRLRAMLSDELLELFIDIAMPIERTGVLPTDIELNIMRLIPKASGGRRPIALLSSFVRVWAKVRRAAVGSQPASGLLFFPMRGHAVRPGAVR